MKKILLFLWQLPQNVLGLLVYLVNIKSVRKVYDSSLNVWFYSAKHVSDRGLSLGKFIFLDSDNYTSLNSIRHERGHQKQSLYLGWLYLLVIGLPSLIRNIMNRTVHKKWSAERKYKWYYGHYPERWADKLGNVSR